MTRRRAFVLVAGLLALGALVLAVILAVPRASTTSQLPNEVKQQLAVTQLGSTSATIMKPGRAITTMVGPGNAQWWQIETSFVQDWRLQQRWADMSVKPSTVGFTLFYSAENPSQRLATPALLLGFDSTKDAQATAVAYNRGALASPNAQYQALALGGTTVVVPSGIYTDKVFNNTLDFKVPAGTVNKLSGGYWIVNAKALDEYVKRQQATKDRAAYLSAVQALGFNTAATGATWYARSTDGLHWRGQLAAESGPVWQASDVSPSKFYRALASTAKRINEPTQEQLNQAAEDAGDPNAVNTNFFIVQPRQSIIAQYFAIATGGKVSGTMTDLQGSGEVAVKAPADTDKVVYVVEPNVWFNSFTKPDTGDLWYLFGYKQATLTFYKSDPARLDIALTPLS